MYIVIIESQVAQGKSPRIVAAKLAETFKLSEENFSFLIDGKEKVVKRCESKAEAMRFARLIIKTGARVRIDESATHRSIAPSKPVTPRAAGATPSDSIRVPPSISPDKPPTMDLVQLSVSDTPKGTCRKCGYQALSSQDPLLTAFDGLGQCPECGVIQSKLPATDQNTGSIAGGARGSAGSRKMWNQAGPEEPEPGTFPVASVRRRLRAGIVSWISFSITSTIMLIPIFPFVAFKWIARVSDAQRDEVQALYNPFLHYYNAYLFDYFKAALFVIPIAALYAFVFTPITKGRTSGQRTANLYVLNSANHPSQSLRAAGLRLLGYLLTPLGYFLPLLIPVFRTDQRSLSDMMSGTRQVEDPRNEGGGVLKIIGLVIIINIFFHLINLGVVIKIDSIVESKTIESAATETVLPTYETMLEATTSKARSIRDRQQRLMHMVELEERCVAKDFAACERLEKEFMGGEP